MFIKIKSSREVVTVNAVRITEMIMVKRKDKATICFKRLSSFAPKACDTITPNPWASPDAKPSTRNIIEPVAPTAARASSPKNCPTMMVSTML